MISAVHNVPRFVNIRIDTYDTRRRVTIEQGPAANHGKSKQNVEAAGGDVRLEAREWGVDSKCD